jgi:hypothetical protein
VPRLCTVSYVTAYKYVGSDLSSVLPCTCLDLRLDCPTGRQGNQATKDSTLIPKGNNRGVSGLCGWVGAAVAQEQWGLGLYSPVV